MAETSREPLDLDALTTLTRRAGLALTDDELAALHQATAAIAAAVDAFDAPITPETEPAAYFRLDREG